MIISTPLMLAFGWVVVANVIAMFPSPRHRHWPAAYGLIAVGIPLLIWLYLTDGALIAALFLVAGASILRWPVRYLGRWVRGKINKGSDT